MKIHLSTLGSLIVSTLCFSHVATAQTIWGEATHLGNAINSSAIDSGANVSADGLTLYFHSNRTGDFDLYQSTRASINSAWSPAVNLGVTLNTGGNDRAASISTDGLTLYFSSDRDGDSDLYQSTRATTSDAWGAASKITGINSSKRDSGPTITADGLTMFFQSDRNDATIILDIFKVTRASVLDDWSSPAALGLNINTPGHELAPSLSGDGLSLFFHSDRAGGPGFYNVWQSERTSLNDQWSTPMLLNSTVNTSGSALGPDVSDDGSMLFFASDRTGGIDGSRDIWMVSAVPVPAAVWLFGSGLLSLLAVARRRGR